MSSSAYERQQRDEAGRKARFGPAARDLAAYLAERAPDTAGDYQDSVEQWLRDNGGFDGKGGGPA